MKKIIMGIALLCITACSDADSGGATSIDPLQSGSFQAGRMEQQRVSGWVDYVITDHKTGCQYALITSQGGMTLLGCFDEYKTGGK